MRNYLNNKFLIKVVKQHWEDTQGLRDQQFYSDYEMYLQELDDNIGAENDLELE